MSASASAIISSDRSSAGAVKSLALRVTTQAKGLDSEAVFSITAQALTSLQDQLNILYKSARASAAASGSSTPSTATALFSRITLTVATTNISSPGTPNDGQLFIQILIQDATGARQITWDAAFKGVTPNTIDVTANAVNVYLFTGSSSSWQLAAMPALGV